MSPPYTGDVQFTVVDNGGGIISAPSQSVQAIIGCSTSGTVGQVVATRDIPTIVSTFASGPMVESAAMIVAAGGTALCVRTTTATPGGITAQAIPAGITATDTNSPILVTSVAHGLSSGAVVTITGTVGQTGANGTFRITKVSADTFTLDDSTSVSAWVSGGTIVFTGSMATLATASTGAMWFTGTPDDDIYPMAVVQTGFTEGVTGGTVLLSLDRGATYGPPIPVGTGATVALKDVGGRDTGLVVNFSAGKVFTGGGISNGSVIGDSVRCSTVGPQPNDAGIVVALAALQSYVANAGGVTPIIQIVGNMAASDAAAIESGGATNLDTMATQYLFERAIISARDAHAPVAWGGIGEPEATWKAAVILDFSATVARRVCATAGHYNMLSAISTSFASLPKYRRPLSFALGAREVVIAPQRHAGKVAGNEGGPLAQIVINPTTDAGDGFVYHDELFSPGFDYYLPGGSGRFSAARHHLRKPGWFMSNPLTLAPQGSDFSLLPRALVMDVACTITHGVLSDFIASDFTTKTNGTLSDAAANTISGAVSSELTSSMVGVGMISSFTVAVDQTANFQVSSTLKVTIQILGVGYVLEADVTISYVSQLAAAA